MEEHQVNSFERLCDECENLNPLLLERKWSEVYNRVSNLTSLFSESENRKKITKRVLKNLSEILEVSVKDVKADNAEVIVLVTEVFRALRNSCVSEPGNQHTIVVNTTAVEDACSVVKVLLQSSGEESVICLQVCTQFLGNLIVKNKETQQIIWNKCSGILLNLIKHEDNKVANYSSMVIYNILLGCSDITDVVEGYRELFETLIENAMKDSEFALFTIQLLLSRPGCLPKVYEEMDVRYQLFLLDTAHCMVFGESNTSIPLCTVTFLAEKFKSHSDLILKTCDKYVENLEPVEVSKLLQFLASTCAEPTYQSHLQKDKSLLITCAMLLRSIHSLGKAGENNFTLIQKMADLTVTTQDHDIVEHPAFGFKSSLIQILANLCWRNRDNQNEVRELDCIPVLLDCCNIDARNPLIIQWVVLAIRNLCENNQENQTVIASMTKQGTVDSSILQEMGLTIHEDKENKLIVVPLEKKASSP